MILCPSLTAGEAAMYESLVVPRYMQAFGAIAVPLLIPHTPAILAHLACRTGYPAALIGRHLAACSLTGVDTSPEALDLARTKASLMSGVSATYLPGSELPVPLPAQQFTHTLHLHPLGNRGDYGPVFAEHHRLLTPGGQMVVALPLRGSYPEIYDMFREYALRHEQPHFGEAVDAAASLRPNPETLAEQIEQAGFEHVDVSLELVAIPFNNGRDFLEDPISRLVVGPDIRWSIPIETGVEQAMSYATDAISKYWSEIRFELTVNIASVSARKIG